MLENIKKKKKTAKSFFLKQIKKNKKIKNIQKKILN